MKPQYFGRVGITTSFTREIVNNTRPRMKINCFNLILALLTGNINQGNCEYIQPLKYYLLKYKRYKI